jgi:hypothetical protein
MSEQCHNVKKSLFSKTAHHCGSATSDIISNKDDAGSRFNHTRSTFRQQQNNARSLRRYRRHGVAGEVNQAEKFRYLRAMKISEKTASQI